MSSKRVVLGMVMVVLEQNTLFIIDIVALVVGPIAVIALVFLLASQDKLYWSSQRWIRFPLALIFGAAATVGLAYVNARFAPYVSRIRNPISCLASVV